MSGSTFSNSTASSNAGGIMNSPGANLTVTTSSFINLTCGSDGAGIDQDGTEEETINHVGRHDGRLVCPMNVREREEPGDES